MSENRGMLRPLSKQRAWLLQAPAGGVKTFFPAAISSLPPSAIILLPMIAFRKPYTVSSPVLDPVAGQPGFLHSLRASDVQARSASRASNWLHRRFHRASCARRFITPQGRSVSLRQERKSPGRILFDQLRPGTLRCRELWHHTLLFCNPYHQLFRL